MRKLVGVIAVVIAFCVLGANNGNALLGTCTEGGEQTTTTTNQGGYLTSVYPGDSTCPGWTSICCQTDETGTKKTYQTGADGTPCTLDTLRSTNNNYPYKGC